LRFAAAPPCITALQAAVRYSEDIDLVQTQAEQSRNRQRIREALSWLGDCKREQAGHSMHFVFRFAPEAQPDTTLKIKVEINTPSTTACLYTELSICG